uniref:Uncharacterized protein n=1 Tax=Arundo donax TaxID=35708 RepID=A0A0A9G0D4_ARUDO
MQEVHARSRTRR